jgi:dTDP-4-dehydrorhamnose reductase
MRILLLGGTGQVGTEIRSLAPTAGIEVTAPGHAAVDFRENSTLAEAVANGPWNAVINAAAYTDVDRAESEEALALVVNGDAPSLLAALTERVGVPLIHISTDYVFDGRKGEPYVEQDKVGPLNAYGRSKLAGEQGIRAAGSRNVILRTSWVYSPYGRNFVKTILRLGAERDCLNIVADQRGCPTAARDVAGACLAIARRCASAPERAPYGIYHFAGAGEASWFEFASEIIGRAKGSLAKAAKVLPIRTVDYPTPATRPLDTRLNSGAIDREFGIKARPWRDALVETVDHLLVERTIA